MTGPAAPTHAAHAFMPLGTHPCTLPSPGTGEPPEHALLGGVNEVPPVHVGNGEVVLDGPQLGGDHTKLGPWSLVQWANSGSGYGTGTTRIG